MRALPQRQLKFTFWGQKNPAQNGMETSKGSFLKFTSLQLNLLAAKTGVLKNYKVAASNKALSIVRGDTYHSKKVNWICRWRIYPNHSSGRFYETGDDDFGFLKSNLMYLIAMNNTDYAWYMDTRTLAADY